MPRSDPPQPRWLDEREQRAWWALLEVGSGLFDALSVDLRRRADLTLEDYEVLHLLSVSADRSMRVGQLADEMLSSRTRLSQRLDRLAGRGLLEKRRCPQDRRAIDVVLTTDGMALLEATAPGHVEWVRENVFDLLTAGDVDAIARSLGKVAQHLHDERRAGRL
jgi:DNA-binding MarR family transcriptional regulator